MTYDITAIRSQFPALAAGVGPLTPARVVRAEVILATDPCPPPTAP